MGDLRDIDSLPRGKPDMQFIEKIRDALKLGAREFGRVLKLDHQLISTWINGAPKMRDFLTAICKIRKLSGKSWNQFGDILDGEFLSSKEWEEAKKLLEAERTANRPKGKK